MSENNLPQTGSPQTSPFTFANIVASVALLLAIFSFAFALSDRHDQVQARDRGHHGIRGPEMGGAQGRPEMGGAQGRPEMGGPQGRPEMGEAQGRPEMGGRPDGDHMEGGNDRPNINKNNDGNNQ